MTGNSIIGEKKSYIDQFSLMDEFKRSISLMISYLQEYFKFEPLNETQIFQLLETLFFQQLEN